MRLKGMQYLGFIAIFAINIIIMIEYIRGELTDLTPTMAVVDCNGVGYGLWVSLNTFTSIQGKKEVKLYVYESIREDAYQLYGFATKFERELFLLLISVSGIGGNTARMILSALTPEELRTAVGNGDERLLKTVKGIGLKTAQRIIVDLKDKVVAAGSGDIKVPDDNKSITGSGISIVREEAIAALTTLGFAPQPVQKVVGVILKESPDMAVEQVIKQALKRL